MFKKLENAVAGNEPGASGNKNMRVFHKEFPQLLAFTRAFVLLTPMQWRLFFPGAKGARE